MLFSKALTFIAMCLLIGSSFGAAVEIDTAEQFYVSVAAQVTPTGDEAKDELWIPGKEELSAPLEGDKRTSLWYRFDILNRSAADTWYLQITNSLISEVHVYTVDAGSQHHGLNGYIPKTPFDLTNAVEVSFPAKKAVSVWVNVQAPYVSPNLLISLLPEEEYFQHHFNYTTMILIAIGAMLALVIYNTFLYFPTRDSSFLWYASYQVLCTFAWAMHFKIMLYCFGLKLDASTLYLPFFIAAATCLMFAITFLRLPQRGWLALLVRAFAIALVVFGLLGLLLPLATYQTILALCIGLWLLIMLGLGIWRFNKGYRPARIYVVGFSVMTTYYLFTMAGNLAGATLFDNLMLGGLWAQLFDSIALALALADRINFLRKSRQHADKRASTDQLTGLPNRTAFERDVRAWEVYYSEGIVQEFFLTFIDVDGLKRVNDQRGHNEGDRLLALVAQWLTAQSHQQNVYRIGGDEFVILSRQQIQWNLTSLHNLLASEGFPNSDLSIGTSSYSESGSRSTLLKLADERMYAIKQSNR